MSDVASSRVDVFFYGTFMSAKILRDFGIDCNDTVPSKITDFQLSIRPRVNLIRMPGSTIYGAVANITHGDIASLYGSLADDFGIVYHPYAVTALSENGGARPALCYISHNLPDAEPDPDYVKELANCARQLGASQLYINHIMSFLPDAKD